MTCNHIQYSSIPDISYADFTPVFLEKILKARYILKEFPNAIFYTKKKKKNLIEKLLNEPKNPYYNHHHLHHHQIFY